MAESTTGVPDPATGLTPKDIALIKNSWAGPRQKPTESGIALFNIFFKNHPEYQQAFPFRDVPKEDLPKNKRFLAHANGVIYGFSSIVDAVDDPEMLVPILSRIGESHAPRRIEEKSFSDLQESLIELFTAVFNEEEVAAWKKALNVAFPILAEGFREKRKK